MLQTDTQQRFQDADELVAALKGLACATPVPPVATDDMKNERPRWLIPGIAAAAAGVFLLAGLVWLLNRSGQKEPAESPAVVVESESESEAAGDTGNVAPDTGARQLLAERSDPVEKDVPAVGPRTIKPPVRQPARTGVAKKKPLPPANSVLVTTTGNDEKQDLITAYAQSALSEAKWAVVDSSSLGNRKASDVARYNLVITISKMGSTPLKYMGRESEMHTVALTMKLVVAQTGGIASGPVSKTTRYTALTAEENLKKAVAELTGKLKLPRSQRPE